MGYTHYWNQERSLTREEWEIITTDLRDVLTYAQHECGIALADGMGEGGTSPEIGNEGIMFNGVGDDSHEGFYIKRTINTEPDYPGQEKRHYAAGFCKTERKPYDAVVTACLCYLSTITRKDDASGPIIGSEAFTVGSDGSGSDFLIGLDLARKALPRVANQLDIPMDVMKSDRWCAPWVNTSNLKTYGVHFCIDGKGYVLRPRTGESYCFESHIALAQFLEKTKAASFATGRRGNSNGWGSYDKTETNIWDAMGSFDEARHKRIALAQKRVLEKLFPVDAACAQQPPAYVRPGEMPENGGREFCYSVSDLLNLAKT